MTPRVVTIRSAANSAPWDVSSQDNLFSVFLRGPFSNVVDGQELPLVLMAEEARALGQALIEAAAHARPLSELEPKVTP